MTQTTSRVLARLLFAAGVAVVAGPMVGCVSQNEYDSLDGQIRSLRNTNNTLSRERDEAVSSRDAALAQLALSEQAVAELRRVNADLLRRLEDAGLTLSDLEKRMAGIQLAALDPGTDSLLRELAARYPDLLTYDAARGMIKFNSDLTFDSGDDTVKPAAQQALAALADILNNPITEPYDVIIVGHTDSQRISARTAARHPSNLHLSAHRAISVHRALVQQSVRSDKMQIAGWGEYRPLVANNQPSGNTPENRRVEIYLTRLKLDGGAIREDAGGDGQPADRTATPARDAGPRRPAEIIK